MWNEFQTQVILSPERPEKSTQKRHKVTRQQLQ
ncbi:hypothetical protein TNCV_3409451, partial [Trichonephila clavipes]